MFGGGNMDSRQMQQMMEQLGVDLDEMDAEEVRITLDDGRELVFTDVEVTHMSGQGMNMYQIVGEPEEDRASGDESNQSEDDDGDNPDYTEEDVELVADRAGVSDDDARQALADTGGDLAAAIEELS